MVDIQERLKLHFKAAKEYANSEGFDLASVCLRGSQNYGLADENSDVDTVAFVVPRKEALIFGTKLSKELHIDDEHCVVKDIRLLYEELVKGSPNMIEAIMTAYHIDAEEYQICMGNIRCMANVYARINPARTIKALCGMGFSPTGKNYHLYKNYDMIKRYMEGRQPYHEILIPVNPFFLQQMKKSNYRSPEMVEKLKELQASIKESDYKIDEAAIEDLKEQILKFFD